VNLKASSVARNILLVMISIAGILTIIASNGGGGQPPVTPTTGSIAVNTGFGAVSSVPYQCSGPGNITISPLSLTGTAGKNQPETKPFSHAGFSSTTPNEPACQQTVVFTDLKTGTWQASDGNGACTATVTAGQMAMVKIWNGACR